MSLADSNNVGFVVIYHTIVLQRQSLNLVTVGMKARWPVAVEIVILAVEITLHQRAVEIKLCKIRG